MLRVTGILITLVVLMLALGALAPAAGAIYIEGQPIPDDGMMHILAAEEGSPVSPGTAGDGIGGSLTGFPYAGLAGLGQGFPATLTTGKLPVVTTFEEASLLPDAIATFEKDLAAGDVVGQTMPPSVAGFWNFADPGSFRMNMPALSGLFD